MEDHVTLTEAAERLDVHYMTAYRYVRTGRLRAHKDGGVWRVPLSGLAGFDADAGTAPGAPEDRRGSVPPLLASRLLAGDENGSLGLLTGAMASGAGLEEAFIDLLGAAMHLVGDMWERDEATVSDEHVASACATRVAARLGASSAHRGRSKGSVILAGVQGDRHALPSAVMRNLLANRGFAVVDLGADTPFAPLVARALATDSLLAVGVVATKFGNQANIVDTLEALETGLNVPVVLGGSALRNARHAHTLGECLPSTSPRDALELFTAIHRKASART